MIQPVYENKWITLYQGDCLEVMKQLDMKFDCCITDLPFGITSNEWDNVIPFKSMWKELDRLVQGAICLFGSQPFSSLLVCSNLKQFRHEWIWQKNRGSNFANTVREPMKEHEHILVFSKEKWVYNKQMQQRAISGRERANYNVKYTSGSSNYRKFENREQNVIGKMRVPSSIQKCNTEVGLHPTQKPIRLLEYLVRTYSNRGDRILDFTSGSGSTGIACMEQDRRCVCIEREQKYIGVMIQRFEKKEQEIGERLF